MHNFLTPSDPKFAHSIPRRPKIVFERKYLHEQAAQEVKHMKLWGRFRSMDVNDLATTYSHVVAKP